MRCWLFSIGLGVVMVSSLADAREKEECQTAWGGAAHSYLTQNRNRGPNGESNSADVNALWEQLFAPACTLESQGKKDDARVEAVMLGAKALAKLDMRGCQRFMEVYVSSSRPKDVCDAALAGDEANLRKVVTDSMPARGSGKPAPKKKKK
jgi:hypothetical protein